MYSLKRYWKYFLSTVLILFLLINDGVWVHPHVYATGVSPQAVTVYGQSSFTSSTSGTSSTTLSSPRDALFDSSGGLYIADYGNNRVLYYASGSTTATRVYGQGGSFTSNTVNNGGVSATSLNGPHGLALDGSGNLYIADNTNNRVLYYPSGSTTATRVYGQGGSFTSKIVNNGGVSATSLYTPNNIALDSNGNLYIADAGNNRVLYFASGSTTATRVYGQSGSYTTTTANNGGVSATSLNHPGGVSLDSSNNLYVADSYNNRVLYYASGSTTATRVYGQAGSYTTTTGSTSATGINGPGAVGLDSNNNLYVQDGTNNRVLYYASGSTTATRVYGQAGSFTTATANNGGVSATSLNVPYNMSIDSNSNLYIVDSGNNRVLKFQTSLSVTTQPPSSSLSGGTFSTATSLIDVGSGTTFTDFGGTVSVAIRTGTGASGATLSGTTSVTASSGVATFSNLSINLSSAGYMLTFSSSGVGSATTNAFIMGSPAPAGYWPLDDGSGTTVSDSSANNNAGTIVGTGTSWSTSGQVNGSLTFTGSTSTYVSMGAPTALQFGTGSFTVMSWFNTSNTAFQRMVDMGMDTWDTGFELSFDETGSCPNSGTGCVTVAIGGGTQATSISFGTTLNGLNDGKWHQTALVVDQTGHTAQLYVDGVVQPVTERASTCTTGTAVTSISISGCSSLNATSSNLSNEPFTIGALHNGTTHVAGNPFIGSLDEVRAYNKALSSSQIQSQYTSDTTPTLSGYWPFEEGSGTSTADLSGNNNTGTLTGASWTTGKVNGALSFNGSSNYVSMGTPTTLQFSTGSFTVMNWFKTSSTAGFNRMVGMGDYGWTTGYFTSVGPYPTGCTGCVGGGMGGGTQAASIVFYTTSSFNDGNWHQEATIVDQSAKTIQVYIDGVAQSLTVQSGTCGTASGTSINISSCTSLNATSAIPFTVSSYNGAHEFFNGSLDEIRVYGSALTSSQVQKQYALDTIPSPAGYWHFDEANGTTAYDSSSNADNGTLTSGPTWTSGEINSGLSFNGSSNYVSMGTPTALKFGTGSFTVMNWFKTSSTAGFNRMVGMGDYGWTTGYFTSVGPYPTGCTGCVGGGMGGGTQAASIVFYTTSSFNDGNWHQEATIVDQSAKTIQVYIDGVAQSLTVQSGTCGTASGTSINISSCTSLNATSAIPFTVSSYNGAHEFFNGSLDEIRVYGSALNSYQIQNLYTNDTNALSEYATNASFSAIVGSTTTYTLPISLTYQTTPAPGWNLSITSTTLTSGANTLPTTASTITSVTGTCNTNWTCTSNTLLNTISSFPLTLPAGTTAPTAIKFFGTAVGTGTGAYTVTPTFSVTVPITAQLGTYTSTITLTVATGP